MFDKIKLAIAKAAPMLFTAYAIVEEPDEADVEVTTETEEQATVAEKPNTSDTVKRMASTVTKIYMDTIPVNEETPMNLTSQIVDVAFTTTAQAAITGAVAMFTANRPLPIRIVSGIVAFAAASKLSEKWKNEMVHPIVEDYKEKLKTVLAAQHIDPEFNVALDTYFNDGATPDEKAEAVSTIVDAVYPTDDLQNRLFMETHGDGDMMVAVCMDAIERRALNQNKFYTEFLNKPFIEQKWFVKAKNWFKKFKELFADRERTFVEKFPTAATYGIFGIGASIFAFGIGLFIDAKKESVCNA